MNKIILTVMLLASTHLFSQVGIGTTNPEGALDVVSSNSGVIVPRVATNAVITTPVNGMIIYDISNTCIRAYENNAWSNCLSGKTTTTAVLSPTGRIWMDRNLGATRVATSSTDYLAYGDLYQWGRKADGHQIIVRTAATETNGSAPAAGSSSSSAGPVVAGTEGVNFITNSVQPYDWLATKDNTRWQTVADINNPCPTGYRVPTSIEFNNELLTFTTNNAAGAFASPLKLPVAGRRNFSNFYDSVGTQGYYWTSTTGIGASGRTMYFSSTSASVGSTSSRAQGFSIRCIKD
ncbi:FISUMP domain-containing protein [uncultured Flavobacterium sp.]|uniref:FISUMP domain-containing protein n=1 Tax=uncultured Flavobacterium sp. TaxID=165435 RepID=UPI0030CA130D